MKARTAPVIGAFVLALLGLSLVLAFISQRGVPGRQYTYVKVAFDNVGPALRPGNDVRIAGVRIGQVRQIEGKDGKAVVTLQLDGQRAIYRDATAYVAARSALGQKLIQLQPGTPAAGQLGPGELLRPGRAGNATDLDALLAVLDPATRTALGNTLRTAGQGTANRAQDINSVLGAAPSLLDDASAVSRALSAPEAGLPTLLTTARTLSQRFTGQEAQIAGLIGDLGTTTQALAVDRGQPLATTVHDLPQVLGQTRSALTALAQPLADVQATTDQLSSGAAALGAGTPDIRGVLREAVPPLKSVPGVARKAEPAVDSLTKLVVDARPLAPKVRRAVTLAQTPLDVLAPYSPEVSLWFAYARNALGSGDKNGHWLRFNVLLNSESVSGSGPLGVVLPDPITRRNAYPAPGQAQTQTTTGGTR